MTFGAYWLRILKINIIQGYGGLRLIYVERERERERESEGERGREREREGKKETNQ